MIDFNTAINLIRRNGGFKPNDNDDSYYRTYKTQANRPIQVRVSNHGTHLWSWYDKDFDPSYSINICIVFSEKGSYNSNVKVNMDIKDKGGNIIGQKKSFEVIQYVYDCELLQEKDATLINQKIQSILSNKIFQDPFEGTPKHAKVYKLYPNKPIETIIETKSKNMKTNKKVVRLTESKLKQMIAEAVQETLNEYGETPKEAYDLGRLYGRYKANALTKSLYYPSNENEYLNKLSDMQKYIDAKKFDVARRRAFDRGTANQRFMTDLAFGVNDRRRGYEQMVRDRDNADNLESSFSGREFMDDWTPSR